MLWSAGVNAQTFTDPHGLEDKDFSPSYHSVAAFYKNMGKTYPTVRVKAAGPTDTDEPLLIVYYSADSNFNINKWKAGEKLIILINNGIHPGEPDGIVASMQLLWDITHGKINIPDYIVLAIVPVFNISGAERQRTFSRANQNGPLLTGFRGNAQNLDLNRDFIKMDALETRSLAKQFRLLDPDILIDNHVSNGADYQHAMTLLSTQHNKLGGPMGKYLNTVFEPALYEYMKKKNYDLVPYVNVWGHSPDTGWRTYIETPRYLSGYAAVFNTYAFVAETHMLKPYAERVKATYALMETVIDFARENAPVIMDTRAKQQNWIKSNSSMAIDWTVDTTTADTITFKGYESGLKKSEVSGFPRLYYDRSKPYTKEVPFYGNTVVSKSVKVPEAYIIPKGWNKVMTRLKQSGVVVDELEADEIKKVTVYSITGHNTAQQPYEGHYLHKDITVSKEPRDIQLHKGDYIIKTNQPARRYIVEVLEPEGPDAFLAWGFFDAVLQQKEYFSPYVFEDVAAKMLATDSTLNVGFQQYKAEHPEAGSWQQLLYIYQHSPYYEPEHMRYPVYRLE